MRRGVNDRWLSRMAQQSFIQTDLVFFLSLEFKVCGPSVWNAMEAQSAIPDNKNAFQPSEKRDLL